MVQEEGKMSDENQASAEASETKVPKSIVPSKYGNKYKKGGSDALANFINTESAVEGKFSFDRFFALCRANGVKEEQVAKYEAQVAEKRHGAPGRARMTLRNMLSTIAKKTGKLVGIDGTEHAFEQPGKSGE